MDLYSTSADTPFSGIFREAGTANGHPYYANENGTTYITASSDGIYRMYVGFPGSLFHYVAPSTGSPLGKYQIGPNGIAGKEPNVAVHSSGGDDVVTPEDTTITVPEAAPEVGAKGIKIGDVFIPVCPNPADTHLDNVSDTGKNIALGWCGYHSGTQITAVNTTAQALTDGWLSAHVNASAAGQYLEIITWKDGNENSAVGDTQQCFGISSLQAMIFVPRGNFYKINTDATLLWAEWIPCNGASE